ncbi:MAG TPA: hypothetical protein PKY56_13860 [Candidatus Kapabacteria bacterium]|nr:hypothetical protein [Candidatus Kapabacteria bacterium]
MRLILYLYCLFLSMNTETLKDLDFDNEKFIITVRSQGKFDTISNKTQLKEITNYFITILDTSRNNLNNVARIIKDVKSLYVYCNNKYDFNYFFEQIYKFQPDLYKLIIIDLNDTIVPISISLFKQLGFLTIESAKPIKLPDYIFSSDSLMSFASSITDKDYKSNFDKVDDVNIVQDSVYLPKIVINHKSLRYLAFYGHETLNLDSIFNVTTQMPILTNLMFDKCKINKLPDSISQFRNKVKIEFIENCLDSLSIERIKKATEGIVKFWKNCN